MPKTNYSLPTLSAAVERVAPVCIAVLNTDLEYLFCSNAYLESFFPDNKQLTGRTISELAPGNESRWSEICQRALAGERCSAKSEPYSWGDEHSGFRDWEVAPWFGTAGELGGVTLTFLDVSEQQRTIQRLERATDRFEHATQACQIGVFEYNRADEVIYLNDVAMNLLDLSTRERDSIDIDRFKGYMKSQSVKKFERFLVDCITSQDPVSVVLHLHKRDGSPLSVQMSGQHLEEVGRSVGVAGVFTEISQQLQLAAQTEDALQTAESAFRELQEQQKAQQRMFTVIGHELRAPAAAIKMMIDDDEALSKSPHYQTLSTTVDQLLNVLNELRNIAQPNDMNLLSREVIAPFDAVNAVIQSVQPAIQAAGIELNFSAHESTHILCELNAKGLAQIVEKLIGNVLTHANAHRLWIRLGAATRRIADGKLWMQLKVSDDGKGISPDHQEHLFEPFYRGDAGGVGTGLGLSICQTIAQTLGGLITYSDRASGGSEFTLNMVVSIAGDSYGEPAAVDAMIVSHEQPDGSNGLKGLYILLAEQNKTIRILTKAILMKAGAKVALAEDGNEALEMFNANRLFDVVITEIFMPGVNGYDLSKKLRELGYDRPIIGLTAAAAESDMNRLKFCGADEVLSKPLDLKRLNDAIWTSIAEKRELSGPN